MKSTRNSSHFLLRFGENMNGKKFELDDGKTESGKKIGAWFRDARNKTRLSQRVLAENVGVSHSVIGKLETCGRKITLVEFVRLCHVYNLSPHAGIEIVMNEEIRSGEYARKLSSEQYAAEDGEYAISEPSSATEPCASTECSRLSAVNAA